MADSSGKRTCDLDEEDGPVPKTYKPHNPEVVANHYNSRTDGGHQERRMSNIYHLRNFNNWVKSQLINTYVGKIRARPRQSGPLRVLDMCSGKGGDLNKWKAAGINHLVCTDIAEVSVDQCKQRYEDGGERRFGYKIEHYVVDSTVDSHRAQYTDKSINFHLVSCQFAFHYCFESLPQAECMLRNASECLRTGGFFFGTMPDANEIMRRQQLAEEEEFGNEVYKISFECNVKAPPLFGAKYNFYLDGVVNCPEFLVHFGTLVKLAKRFGLRLIDQKTFHDFFREQTRDGNPLLERMNALQTYTRNDQSPVANFRAAREYMEAHPGAFKVGTLSKCEWETIMLYQVFAFEKVEGHFDSQLQRMVYDL